MKALQAAMDNLSFAFPAEEGKTVTIEAEHGTLIDDHSNDRDQWGGNYPMEITDFEGASGGKIVNAINNGDAVTYRVNVKRAGTYSVTLTYSSGSASNAIKLSDDSGVFKAIDSVSAGHTNPNELKTVTFDLVAKKPGTTTLTVGTPGSASAPRLDKFDITLKRAVADKAELQKAVDKADELNAEDYSADSWRNFQAALAAAQTVLDNEDATQAQVNDALAALNDARDALAEAPAFAFPTKSGETVTIEAEDGTMLDDHSNDADQWGGTYPMTVMDLDGASGGKVVDAIMNGDAISYRVKVERPGTYSVKLTYSSGSESNAVKLSDNGGVFEAVDSVSAGGTNPRELKTVTFDLVAKKAGTTTLTVGTPGNADAPRLDKFDITLAAPVVDKTELQKAVDDAANLSADDYTADTWANFESALNAARDALANDDAAQEQVDDALKALNDARAALAEKPVAPAVNKAELQKAVDEAASLKAEDYTAGSWEPFEAALDDAREVLADDDATQDQVNDALAALIDARDALKKSEAKPDPDQPDPGKPNPDQPGSGDQGGNGGQGGTGDTGTKPSGNGNAAAKPATSSKKELPKTGDVSLLSAAIAGASGVAALGAARVVACKRRRR